MFIPISVSTRCARISQQIPGHANILQSAWNFWSDEKRGLRGASMSVRPNRGDLSEIARLIDAGKIKPMVTQVLPLSEAIAAQRQAETHHTQGKVVLRIADEPKS